MTTRKSWKVALVAVAVLIAMIFATIEAQAATTNPYPDVTVKTVGGTAVKSVSFVKKYGGYKDVIKGTYYKKLKNGLYKKVTGKFEPSKKVTRKEFLTILGNLYGTKKVPVTYADVTNANSAVTDRYVKAKLVSLAKKLGVHIKWDKGTGNKLSRASVANYISTFAHFSKAFMPKK